MTRDEAQEIANDIISHLVDNNDGYGKINNLINQIYKDFENKVSLKNTTLPVPTEYSNINQEAFNEWMAYKKYKNKGAITKTLNMLNKYDFQTQQQMVDKSIMNEYKGLFEPKQSFKPQSAVNVDLALENNIYDLIDQQEAEDKLRIENG